MKTLGLAIAMALITTTLQAKEPITPTDRTNVIAFGVGSSIGDIEYRHLFHNSQFAMIALASYFERSLKGDSTIIVLPPEQHMRSIGLGLGIRRSFLTDAQLRPFVQLAVTRTHNTEDGCSPAALWNPSAVGGGEYFVGSRMSLEGSAGMQLTRGTLRCGAASLGNEQKTRITSLNTIRAALGINFYF